MAREGATEPGGSCCQDLTDTEQEVTGDLMDGGDKERWYQRVESGDIDDAIRV